MIDINLLPPKPRAASTGLVLPVLLLLAGLAISAYLGYEYWGCRKIRQLCEPRSLKRSSSKQSCKTSCRAWGLQESEPRVSS